MSFRNVISHDYEDLDYNIVYDVLHQGRQDLTQFIEILEKQLRL